MNLSAVTHQLAYSYNTTPAAVLEVARKYQLARRLALPEESQLRKSAQEMVRLIIRKRQPRRRATRAAA